MPLDQRFAKFGLEGFTQQEILRLLVAWCLPCINCDPHKLSSYCRDCRKQAKDCLKKFKKFGTLRALLSAAQEEPQELALPSHWMFSLKLINELAYLVLKEKIIDKPVYQSSIELFDYLSYSMRDLKKEVFRIIYLNNRNQIIETVDFFEGTRDTIPIRPREIVESALKHSATTLIFAHNHPAGDPSPSPTDKRLTRDLVFIGMTLDIRVLDHIIIGTNTWFSFADKGLIKKYEDDFLNLRIKMALSVF